MTPKFPLGNTLIHLSHSLTECKGSMFNKDNSEVRPSNKFHYVREHYLGIKDIRL